MNELTKRLDDLEARGLRRQLRPPSGVDLTGNDYLGLSRHPDITAALTHALQQGIPHGSTGSRPVS